ncbi:unnamed protein product, partial [Polarella glacialis]
MILGFLAFCIWVFNKSTGFDWLASVYPSDEVHLPLTDSDWLHVAEDVHMKLFLGMVFYFALISRVVAGSTGMLRHWEKLRLRRKKVCGVDGTFKLKADSDLEDYLIWRAFFLDKLVMLQFQRPAQFKATLPKLGIDPAEKDAGLRFRHYVATHFAFSAYLALNVEAGVSDMIEVHNMTWLAVLVVSIFLAVAFRFGEVNLIETIPFFIGIAVILLASMWLVVWKRQGSIRRKGKRSLAQDIMKREGIEKGKSARQVVGTRTTLNIPDSAGQQKDEDNVALSPEDSPQSAEVPDAFLIGKVPAEVWGEVPEEASPASESYARRGFEGFHQKHNTELYTMRVLQVMLFMISY